MNLSFKITLTLIILFYLLVFISFFPIFGSLSKIVALILFKKPIIIFWYCTVLFIIFFVQLHRLKNDKLGVLSITSLMAFFALTLFWLLLVWAFSGRSDWH